MEEEKVIELKERYEELMNDLDEFYYPVSCRRDFGSRIGENRNKVTHYRKKGYPLPPLKIQHLMKYYNL